MNVTDNTGVMSYANTSGDLEAITVIYDPNGGFTYGGGWYLSQPGALVANPTATGKASYGFTVNYFRNSTYPKGETQFQFDAGNFEFNAVNFDYLVINNSMAQFRGTGKITGGQSGMGFIMTVIDGQLDGSGVDKIRMKIYNKNTNAIIYDNQPGASDAALPTTAVGSNSEIVINANTDPLLITRTNESTKTEEQVVPNELKVQVVPNPAVSNFKLIIASNDLKQKVSLQVVDQFGRVIETRSNVNPICTIYLGNLYRPGIYYLKVLQGIRHKEIKLIKLSD
jgi:hypothetical protein